MVGIKRMGSCVIGVLMAILPVFCYEVNKCTDKIVYAIFKDRFKEPIEVIYFLMNDMQLYKLTSNYEHRIYFSIPHINKALKKDGYKVSDIMVIIHGHETSRHFSKNDIRTWRRFKQAGFTGNFYIFLKINKTIYEITEDTR